MTTLPPPPATTVGTPVPAAPAVPLPSRLPATDRFEAALNRADGLRTVLAQEASDGAPVSRLAAILAELAKAEAAVGVADRRNRLAVKVASIASRVVN